MREMFVVRHRKGKKFLSERFRTLPEARAWAGAHLKPYERAYTIVRMWEPGWIVASWDWLKMRWRILCAKLW